MLSFILSLALTAAPDDQAALKRTVQVETQALEAAPDDTEALYRLGLAFLSLGEPKKALAPLAQLVSRDPDSLDGKLLYARALRLSGDPLAARRSDAPC
jgi:cytochrome c-type biogenesis protein CcmH/NrfG